jgi:hypothetical protein
MLIVDNLADFSHLSFVHTNTLGGSEDYAFRKVFNSLLKEERKKYSLHTLKVGNTII